MYITSHSISSVQFKSFIKYNLMLVDSKIQIQQYSTIQQYICTLFDSLPKIEISSETLVLREKRQSLIQKLLQQNTCYGHKIIELSEKFTAKFKKEHYLDKKEMEKKIGLIFQLVSHEEPMFSVDQMIDRMIEQLKNGKKSKIMRYQIPESKIEILEFKNQSRRVSKQTNNQNLHEEQKHMNQVNTNKVSPKGKSKRKSIAASAVRMTKSKEEDLSIKQILHIKGLFQNQENQLRIFYEKITKITEKLQISMINMDEQKLKFSKINNQNKTQNLTDLIEACTTNNSENINNLMGLSELIFESCVKKMKTEGLVGSKFSLYLSQIDKRYEVYSYAVSKMLDNFITLKSTIKNNQIHQANKIIQSLEDIARKFYQMYPSHQIMNNLSVDKREKILESHKNQSIQVNTIKNQNFTAKKNSIETYRLQIKINEHLEKFEKNMKFKKTLECKEIEKFFQILREMMPTKPNNTSSELNNFQEEIHKIIELNQKNQKEMLDTYNKKQKKLEKRIIQLEALNSQFQLQFKNFNEQRENQRKKYQKKIQNQKSQFKKIFLQKQNLQKNLNEMLKQIEKMKEAIKNQTQYFGNNAKNIQFEKDYLQQNLKTIEKKSSESIEQLRKQKQIMNEERIIYQQKINLLEVREEEYTQENASINNQLERKSRQNLQLKGQIDELKEQIDELTQVYQDKIKELEDMIQNIRQLQSSLRSHELEIEELSESEKNNQDKIKSQDEELQRKSRQIEKLKAERNLYRDESEKYKEIGILNDSDINALKEEMEKVNQAYLEAEEQLETVKTQLDKFVKEKEKLFKEKVLLLKNYEELERQLEIISSKNQALDLSEKDTREEIYQKMKQNTYLQKDNEEKNKEVSKMKLEIGHLRQNESKRDNEFRQMRQELQKRKQIEGVENGRKRIELEALKVEVRKKTETIEKQRDTYEEKINTLTSKIAQMQEFITQKQLLARITNNHQSQ